VRGRVDKVSRGDKGGEQAHDGTVEGSDQDLRVIDEGVRDVKVIDEEVTYDLAAVIGPIRTG
jgi:hypothetical protein